MRSSGPCAAEPRAATSGPGGSPCWTWPHAWHRDRFERTTSTSTRSCAPPATPRSASSTTSASTRRWLRLKPPKKRGSPSSSSTQPMRAADSTGFVSRASRTICLCPTTEASLGDGFAPIERLCERGIGICIGSDSNVRIDPLEELRELEGIARRRTGRRNVVSPDSLLSFGADEGAASLGLEAWAEIAIDLEHPSLRAVPEQDVFAALVSGCSAEVLAPAVA